MSEGNKITEGRLLSLDFFRGLTMLLLIAEFTHLFRYLVSDQLDGSFLYQIGLQFQHHPWNGLRFWDLIQPFFMFIVGVAMPLSYSKRIKKGETHGEIRQHFLQRSFLLLVLGWALYAVAYGKITWYFQNVLAQLSVTVLISFLIMRKPVAVQLLVSFGLLLLTELLYRFFWVEGYDQVFVANHNFGTWFDSLYNGADTKGHWVSFNAIPTTAHTIWGVLAGKLLMGNKTQHQKLLVLVVAGMVGLLIGYGLNPVTPIIKRISTSSFVIASGGWTILVLALSYWLIDILNYKKGVLFFAIVGMNPLFIYLFAHVGGADLMKQIVTPFSFAAFGWAGDLVSNIVTALVATFLLWFICYFMYLKKMFIKI
jgi:predicted acyltransferase